jgi:hypothetical protein
VKLSEYVVELQKLLEEKGDIEVYKSGGEHTEPYPLTADELASDVMKLASFTGYMDRPGVDHAWAVKEGSKDRKEFEALVL